jgi:hypothetical protein
MYTINASQDIISNDKVVSYKQFREVYKLEKVERQSEDSEEQQCFRETLLRTYKGENNLDDWKLLTTRFEGNLNRIERERFSEAVFILTKWIDVDKINIEMLKELNRPVAKIIAVHIGG